LTRPSGGPRRGTSGPPEQDWLGRYELGPLPPGEYFIASVTDFEEEDIFERETLDQISRMAVRVRLSVGQKLVQDLSEDSGGGL
jgi:hypothetical protein